MEEPHWTQIGKNLISLARDFIIVALVLFLVGCPKQMNDRLTKAGLVSFDAGFAKWESKIEKASQESADAAAQVGKTQATVEASIEQLQKIEAMSNDRQVSQQAQAIREDIARSAGTLEIAKDKLDRSVMVQQQVLEDARAERANAQ